MVIGSPLRDRDGSQTNLSITQVLSTSRIKETRGQVFKAAQRPLPDGVYLSIYKSKDDWEAVQQHSISSITDCAVQMFALRKQGPVLPTLVIQISPDPTTDKLRKRRSSRTAGLTTTKDSGPTTLYFRASDDSHTLNDWARYLLSLIQPSMPDRQPMSPLTPVSPTFSNPFTMVPRDEYGPRPSSGKDSVRPPVFHSQSHQSRPSRDRPITYSSESPSLRSRTSDLSSHANSINAVGMGYMVHNQHYTTVLPNDLPSPATTVGDYQGEYMLGWTSAQGRSSTLSSPVKGRGSVSSQAQSQSSHQATPMSSSPPAPRETILDRAFQMRYIPGSDREVPGEEKLSSLARFDALMREAEGRRQKSAQHVSYPPPAMVSAWEEDDDSDEKDDMNDAPDDDDSSDGGVFEDNVTADPTRYGPPAQHTFHSLSNRHSTMSHSSSREMDHGALALRPQTSHSKRPTMSLRTASQPQIPISTLDLSVSPVDETPSRPHGEKRHSTSSVKRLSFSEFTKRLSSTSSLLLVQTNVSTGSSRGSTELECKQTTPRNGPSMMPRSPRDQEKCTWRGSVGVFGAGEGGFL